MATLCLSIHALYRCRNSGACCSDVWAVPVEQHVVELIRENGLVLTGPGPFIVPSERPEAYSSELVAAHVGGACAFFERETSLCTIHRQRGIEALPSSCRHFPRIHLIDARGTFLSLSHFCPTAARMLLDDVPLAIVEASPPLALDGVVEGLVAIDALPPLVRPGMLADLDSYALWERVSLAALGRSDLGHIEALDLLDAATEDIRTWQPSDGPLFERILTAFDRAQARSPRPAPLQHDRERLDLVDGVLPEALGPRRRAEAAADLSPFDAPVKRYLAARLFGTWLAYRTRGLRSIVEWLRICLAVLRNEFALADAQLAGLRPCAAPARAVTPQPGEGVLGAVTPAPTDASIRTAAFIDAIRETDRVLLHVIHLQVLAADLEVVENAAR